MIWPFSFEQRDDFLEPILRQVEFVREPSERRPHGSTRLRVTPPKPIQEILLGPWVAGKQGLNNLA